MMLATVSFFQPSKQLAMLTGITGFCILVFGIGLLGRLGLMQSTPGWAYGKIALWLVIMGGGHMIAKRVKNPARVGIAFLLACGAIGAFLVLFKPGAI